MSAVMNLDFPLPANMSARDGRDAYLAENGFSFAEYSAPRTKAFFLGLEFSVPNTPKHAWGIMRHDLHHVATGFGTDLTGEGEVSAFEARGMLRDVKTARASVARLGAYVTGLVLLGLAYGLAVAPRRTLRAWRRAGACRALFEDDTPYDALVAGSVGELRARMGLPREGIAAGARGLHSCAPARADCRTMNG